MKERSLMKLIAPAKMLCILFFAFFSPLSCHEVDGPEVIITSFTPASGIVSANVTITGKNFSSIPNQNEVKFNGVLATVIEATPTQLIATVPTGATTGKITVKRNKVTTASSSDFTVLGPHTITSFSPASGSIGTNVTITGTNFSVNAANIVVKINNTPATSVAASATSLTVTVPTGATTGRISVTMNGITVTTSEDFVVTTNQTQTITSFTPDSGIVGTTVTINGTNFSNNPADNVVKFNDTPATVTAASATSLTVDVPHGATTGRISVTVNGITANSAVDFTIPLPTIASFSPAHALPGEVLTITGENFVDGSIILNGVKVNNVDATVLSATSTELTVTVPAEATTGVISVDVGGQVANSINEFEVLVDIPRNGLVAFYPLKGNANDQSGNNLNGTLVNGPVQSADRYQNSNSCYFLDGTSDYIDMGNPAQLQITDKITISVWIRLPALNNNNFETVISKFGYSGTFGTSRPANGYAITSDVYNSLDGKTHFAFQSFIESSTSFASFVVGAQELVLNRWTQATLVIDNGTWTFYRDGVQTNTSTGNATILGDGPGAKLIIGAQADANGTIYRMFHGAVDDIAIYNRALSAAEVAKLYQQTITKY